jgi:DNA-3-methyladenine glycosylase
LPRKPVDPIKSVADGSSWQPLGEAFYQRKDVVKIARELLGKILVTQFDGITTAGRIVETEAYEGVVDKASHAWNGRRTARTEIMYAAGGTSYVYLCYGIHHLFNVVTNEKDTPHAVLIRAVEPLTGIEQMLLRTRKPKADFTLTKGPGNVSKALGIATHHTGLSLLQNEIYIATDGTTYPQSQIIATPRIGVDYAAEDALLPYRFIVKGNPFVSGKKSKSTM